MCQRSKWDLNAHFHNETWGFRRDVYLNERLLACCEASTR